MVMIVTALRDTGASWNASHLVVILGIVIGVGRQLIATI